ncbi:cytochrome ubiquinol oxidase subunit I [Chryseobacterium sp. Bi04]|uniref:cytochrome ubiquinol oxidase subunit I n=1 Tax=Chryseobacterium sp. Bi04 TaxID=2822345 RepID=UPI001D687B2D|nr:cytochrome ubiquinol oxidase subunit I [Chryseobacterium sp. Bi04]CAH0269512.1 Putative cytochrome bd menaquinol oxidase subunit I [Chryseobacterium sp. Bi04]
MDDLMAARSQMAFTLGFHIIFSCIAMVMPFFMAIAHFRYLKTGNVIYKNITRAWARGVAILFITGAVSGTVLSFELGLLWPKFMKHAGPIFGMPFSMEGTFFFIEAIALGFYLYGAKVFNKWFHWFTGVVVGISGMASGILVVAANAWMNSPAGFDYINGQYLNIDPVAAMFNKAWPLQALHMVLAAICSTGFAVAGVHALMVLKRKNVEFHTKAFRIAAIFASIAALLQPLSGDMSAKDVAKRQPAKLAAMEAHFKTEKNVPLIVGGIPDEKTETVNYAIKIPGGLSFLAFSDFNAEVTGLDAFPKDERPPVVVTHFAFQIMVGMGTFMMLIGALYLFAYWRKEEWMTKSWLLKLFVAAIPAGFIALEAGWTVTEVGRQPWIIYGIMKTKDAVNPIPGLAYSFYLFSGIYVLLGITVAYLLYRQVKMVDKLYDVGNAEIDAH